MYNAKIIGITSSGNIKIKEIINEERKNELLESATRALKTQGLNGNWNYDEYMHGLYNGMELILSLVEEREPKFKDAPSEYIASKRK